MKVATKKINVNKVVYTVRAVGNKLKRTGHRVEFGIGVLTLRISIEE